MRTLRKKHELSAMPQHKSFWQIWNMNFGFFGIQFSFGLQQSNMSAIYRYLGADEASLPLLWLAGPITGLLVQPLIGALSDRTWIPGLGRRKPFFLVGALLASAALVAMPFSSALWMAASLLWILDAANNIAMEPYRAFVSDQLPERQHSLGFLMQSFFTGLGSTLANFTPAILVSCGFFALTDTLDNGIPVSTYWAFGIGAFASLASILLSVFTTAEAPPTAEERAEIENLKSTGNPVRQTLLDVWEALRTMPATMKWLIPVKFFTWYAMFCYWQYLTSALALSQFGTLDGNSVGFKSAQLWTGQLNGTYNIVCFVVAFALVPLTRRWGAKWMHVVALTIGGLGLLALPFLSVSTPLLSGMLPGIGAWSMPTVMLYPLGLGIAWASMLAAPYQMLAASIPRKNTGVFMGIFNLFIVVPMMIQIFTVQYFVYDWLGNNPVRVVQLAGAFLVLGALFTAFVPQPKKWVETK